MMGTKLNTLPTPLKIPSMTRECRTALTPQAVNASSTQTVSQLIPPSNNA